MVEGIGRVTVLLSGGIDSAACANFLLERAYTVEGMFIDYGQAAAKYERAAAQTIAARLGIPLRILEVNGQQGFGAGELTGRNAFFVFSALFFLREKPGAIALGIHAGTNYYDCSRAFLHSVSGLVSEHTDGRVSVIAPFVGWSKQDVYDYLCSERFPPEETYSCEAGVAGGCGQCMSCKDRRGLGC